MNKTSSSQHVVTWRADVNLQAAASESELPRFLMVAYTGTSMTVSGWLNPVVIDLSGLRIPSQNKPVRFNHSSTSGVGHTTRIYVEGNTLYAEGVVSRTTPEAADVVQSSRNGFPWQASVGVTTIKVDNIRSGEEVTVNGMKFAGPLSVIREGRLDEISFVDIGADNNTSAVIAASGALSMDEVKNETANDENVVISEVIAKAKAERQRVNAIRALVEEAASTPGADIEALENIADEAIANNWDAQKTELAILRASRPKAPIVYSKKSEPVNQKLLECALALNLGVNENSLVSDREYGEKTVEAAWKYRKSGFRGIAALALEAAGIRVPHSGSEFYSTLCQNQSVQAAGWSNINLPGILGNVANKLLLDAFTNVQTTYELIAQVESVSNFYTQSIYRLDVNGDFQLVQPNGELRHGNFTETGYTNKIDTYGVILGISRQHVINDDLSAFRSTIAQLGKRAKNTLEKMLYRTCVMEASDSFYTTAKGNRLTTSPLSRDNLGAAYAAFSKMVDANGDPILAMPKYLLVPPELTPLAWEIYNSDKIVTGENKTLPDANFFQRMFLPVSSPFLSLGTGSGQSPTTWYVLADPSDVPAFQVAFLDGKRAPTIETGDTEFTTLGIQFRAYWDFGCARIDYRGAVKATA